MVDARGYRVAYEDAVVPILAPLVAIDKRDATDAGRTVGVFDHRRRKSEAAVRLAEARVVRPLDQLVDGCAVAVRAVEVTTAIEREAKRVDLPAGVNFYTRTVRLEAEYIARVELNLSAIFTLEGAGVVEPVGRVDPAIPPQPETRAHAMRVTLVAERAEQHFAVIRVAITGGVCEVPDVRDAPRDAAVLVFRFVPGEHAGRDVEPVGEVADLVGTAIAVGILENLDRVAAIPDAPCPAGRTNGLSSQRRGTRPSTRPTRARVHHTRG